MDTKYTSFELMKMFNIKKGSWYNLKKQLDLDSYAEKVVENKKIKFLYNNQAFELLQSKFSVCSDNVENKENVASNITIYQERIIDMYKKENEYLKQENKRLLDVIAIKEQKEIANNLKSIGSGKGRFFLENLFGKFKRN